MEESYIAGTTVFVLYCTVLYCTVFVIFIDTEKFMIKVIYKNKTKYIVAERWNIEKEQKICK